MINLKEIPCYCINLDNRPGRLNYFLRQPGIKDIPFTRFSAVDGSRIPILNNPQISNNTKSNITFGKRRSHGEINTPGAIGCSLSHYAVWKKFLETKEAPYCLVLEDDAGIPEDFYTSFTKASEDLKEIESFDVWSITYKLVDKNLRPVSNSWNSPVYFWGTSCYIISRQGAQKLMEGFFPIECHLDKYLCLRNSLGHIKLITHSTFKGYTITLGSDIQVGSCDLCNLPDKFGREVITKDYILYTVFTYSIIVTLLFAASIKE
jgi:GR25 family glycosyltransferase involved in LPS biosynthesis